MPLRNPLHRVLWSLAFLVAGVLGSSLPAWSADATGESQQRLERDLKYLASDELEGRGVGLKGLEVAGEFIREQFAAAGLKLDTVQGTPFQNFTMPTGAVQGPVNTLEFVGPDEIGRAHV